MLERKELYESFPLRLGFLASHNGTDMRGIDSSLRTGVLDGTTSVVISNNSTSGAMKYAEEMGIPYYHISDKMYPSLEQKDEAICNTLQMHGVNIVILSGYMKKVGQLTRGIFQNRILNVHPALLPKHKGLWGDSVHEAVLKAREPTTGVTIHTITEEYDEGVVLWQSEVPVIATDTVETLKKKVQEEEINAFVQLLKQIQTGERVL